MTFDDFVINNPETYDQNRGLLHDYSMLNRKYQKAVHTQQTAKPFYSFLTGLTTAFIPFVGGAVGVGINAGTDALVSAHKKQIEEKLNKQRAILGLDQSTTMPNNGLDLYGLGAGIGNSVATQLGRDTLPGNEKLLSTNAGGAGSNMLGYTLNPQQYTDGSGGRNPTAPQLGEGQQTLNLPQTGYWENGGGGVSGLSAETLAGRIQAPPTAMRNGGRIKGGVINGASHEEGGVDLLDEAGNKKGIKVEGTERIVNADDWTSVLSYLKKGKNKAALALLKDIDTRVPKKENEVGANLTLPRYELNNIQSSDPQFIENQPLEVLPQNYPPFTNGYGAYYPALNAVEQSNLTTPHKIGRSGFAPNWKRGLSFDENGKIIDSPQTDKAGNVVSAKNIDWQDTLGNAFDVAKLGLGINGALSPLPKKTVNPEWADYMRKAKYFSQLGLTPESIALSKNAANSDYAAAVRDITNASGGNTGAVLGNLGNVNVGRMKLANQLAEADAIARRNNFDKYQTTVLRDNAIKDAIQNQLYEQAIANKNAGATLASDALANIQGRFDFKKFYGEGSLYDKLQKALVEKGMSEADVAKAMAEYYRNPTHWAANYAPLLSGNISTTTTPTALAANTTTKPQTGALSKDLEDAVIKTMGNTTTHKDLSKTEFQNILNTITADRKNRFGYYSTSDIYDELKNAGYILPKL